MEKGKETGRGRKFINLFSAPTSLSSLARSGPTFGAAVDVGPLSVTIETTESDNGTLVKTVCRGVQTSMRGRLAIEQAEGANKGARNMILNPVLLTREVNFAHLLDST